MTEDYLGFEDPVERQAAQGPAFIVTEPLGPRELKVYHDMMLAVPRAAREMVFTATDETTDEELWEVNPPPRYYHGGEHWQKIMDWPTVPTIEEAMAFKFNAQVSTLAAWWPRLAAARALDEEFGYSNLEDRQNPPGGSQP